jgi:hypothetical protein
LLLRRRLLSFKVVLDAVHKYEASILEHEALMETACNVDTPERRVVLFGENVAKDGLCRWLGWRSGSQDSSPYAFDDRNTFRCSIWNFAQALGQ